MNAYFPNIFTSNNLCYCGSQRLIHKVIKKRGSKDSIQDVLFSCKAEDETLGSQTCDSQHDNGNVMEFKNIDEERKNKKETENVDSRVIRYQLREKLNLNIIV